MTSKRETVHNYYEGYIKRSKELYKRGLFKRLPLIH